MNKYSVIAVALAGLAVGFACGGTTTTPPSGTSGSSSSTTSSGSSTSSTSCGPAPGSTSGGPAACPAALPSGACSPEGLECEYGDDPRSYCRSRAECTTGTWAITSPKCTALPPAMCPASRDAASGKECTPATAVCDYDGSLCECTNCTKYPIERCEGPVTWRCEALSTEPGCPAGRPRLGTSCTVEGALCVYGCERDESRKCAEGAWTSASSPGGCPRSTRRVKSDIHYLSDDERGALAGEARSLRLTTWRYVGKLDDGRTHVGYILEDAPSSPASNMKREEVDLYSYASMTLALAQQQQREIDELKREVAALKKAPR